MIDDLAEGVFKIASTVLAEHRIEPIISLLCLLCTASFVQIAGSLDPSHALLYWLCTIVAVVAAVVGLGGLATHAFRTPPAPRVARSDDPPTTDEKHRSA